MKSVAAILSFVLFLSPLFANAKDVVFKIPAGTTDQFLDWNEMEKPVRAKVGDRLIIINEDSQPHQLHTDGRPCGHGDLIKPGESWSCILDKPYNAFDEKDPTRDHLHYELKFWIIVEEAD